MTHDEFVLVVAEMRLAQTGDDEIRRRNLEQKIDAYIGIDQGRWVSTTPTRIEKLQVHKEWKAAFDDFWERWPRKKSKGAARVAWVKLCPQRSRDIAPLLDRIADQYNADIEELTSREMDKIPYGATWLNAQDFGE